MDIESVIAEVNAHSGEGVTIMEFAAVGANSTIVWVNDAMCRMTGYAREELVGQSSAILRAPGMGDEAVRSRRQAALDGRVSTGEWLTLRKDGSTFWAEMRAVPIRDETGRLRYIIGYRSDHDGLVATRHRLEAEAEHLRQERARLAAELAQLERLSLAARFISDGIMILDTDRRIVWANEGFLHRSGRTLGEIVGRTAAETLRGPSNDPARSAALDARLAQGLGARIENRFLRGDGSEYWVELVIEPMRDATGRVTQFVVVSREVTERKAFEQALEAERARAVAAEQRLRDAVEAVPEGFVLYDAEDRFVTCNERFRELYRESLPSLMPGTPFVEILRYGIAHGQYPDAAGREEEWLARRIAAHRDCGEPTEIGMPNGRRVRVWERRSQGGDTVGFRIDVTDLRDAQARAEAAETRLRAAIEAIPDGILICDTDDRIVLANEAYRNLYDGEGVDLSPGMTFADLMVRLDEVRGVGPLDGLARETIASRQRRLAGREGPSDLHIRHRGRWLRRIDRRTQAGDAVSVRIDITEFRESQIRAEAAEGRLRAAIETIPDAILICDPDDRIVLANEGYRRIYRDDGVDLRLGMTFTELVSAFDRANGFTPGTGPGAEALASREMRLSGEAPPSDFKVPGRDQWFRRIDRRTPEGGVVSVRIDITEFRNALTRAEAAEGRLMTAIEALPDGFVIYDADDRFVLCNSTYRTYFAGAASLLVPGTPFRKVVESIVASGRIREALGREEAWVDARMERHRNPAEASEEAHDNGLWLKVVDRRTPDGGTVGLRIDITDLKRQQARAEAAEQRLMAAIEALPDGFVLFDAEDRFVLCNSTYRAIYARAGELLVPGRPFEDILRHLAWAGDIPEAEGRVEEWIAERMASHRAALGTVDLRRRGDRWFKTIERRIPDGGTVGLRIDVSDLKAEKARAESAERYLREAIEALPDGFVIYDAEDRFVLCNRTFRELYPGADSALTPGTPFRHLAETIVRTGNVPVEPGEEAEWLAFRLAHFRNPTEDYEQKLASNRWLKVIDRRMADGGMVGLHIDVSDLKEQQARLERYTALLSRANARISEKHAELVRSQETAEHRARHDALTGLANRRFLDEVLQGIGLGDGAPTVAILHIDLDRFKEINDTLGHAAGDAVLAAVADRLRETVRTSDFVARVGGDEFVVVCRHAAGRQDLATLSERILDRLRQPVAFESHQCRFGGSIGIAQSGEGIADARALLVRADLALYRAKNTGRNRFEFFDASLMENLNRRKQIADGIAQGIDAGEFRPYYQPQFDLRRFAITGVEALARWERPDGSVLLPGRFLDVATDLGLDAEIDRVILERVARDLADWDRNGIAVPHGSVNVSARRLREPALIDSLRALGLPRGRIVFELLESIFLDQPEGIVAFNLDSLRELGITVELDDFGTGYASLVGLVRLRPSAIKIDQQLVRPATCSTTELKVVEALINIGHAIGVKVIAEGTETAEQVALLASLGCDAAQGDYFAPALPEPAFRRFHAAATSRLLRDGPSAIRDFRRIAEDALEDWAGRRAAS